MNVLIILFQTVWKDCDSVYRQNVLLVNKNFNYSFLIYFSDRIHTIAMGIIRSGQYWFKSFENYFIKSPELYISLISAIKVIKLNH